MVDTIFADERWQPMKLRPDAFTTSRYDDTARLLRDEKQGGKLLEIGCGSGRLTMALAEQFDQLVGIDLSNARIATAKKALAEYHPELAGKIEFVVLDADERFPFDDGCFDVVILCAVLEHMENLFGLMDETARVCKVGGCVVITVPNICYLKIVKDLLLGRVPVTGAPNRDIGYWRDRGWDGGHLHYFSKTSLDALLRHVGFVPEKWSGAGQWAKLRRWYTNLVGDLTVRARRK